jgi:hypothetical protein
MLAPPALARLRHAVSLREPNRSQPDNREGPPERAFSG